jgi:hypothetical protein
VPVSDPTQRLATELRDGRAAARPPAGTASEAAPATAALPSACRRVSRADLLTGLG